MDNDDDDDEHNEGRWSRLIFNLFVSSFKNFPIWTFYE